MTATRQTLARLIDEARLASDLEPVGHELSPDSFLPEVLDSLGLASLIALIEDQWGFEIDDDEIEPELFETLAGLEAFVQAKTAATA